MVLAERTCAKCGAVYLPSRRWQAYCAPECRRAAATKRAKLANPEKFRARVKQWRLRNPRKVYGHFLRWKRANLEHCRAYHQRYREEHREALREKDRQYRLRNALKDMPDNPFVREIVISLFLARGDALRAAYAARRPGEKAMWEAK